MAKKLYSPPASTAPDTNRRRLYTMVDYVASSRTIDVALFIECLYGGGAERAIVLLANELAERGYCVDLILQVAEGPYLPQVSPLVRLQVIGTRNPVTSICWLRNYLRYNEPKKFFTMMEKASLLGVLAGRSCGYTEIFTSTQIDITSYGKLDHAFRRWVLKRLMSLVYPFAKQHHAVSYQAATSLQKLLGKFCRPVTVIYNGFDLEIIRQAAKAIPSHPWLQHKTGPILVACGRLSYQKAYDMMLQALAKLRETVPAKLIILGTGDLLHDLKERTSDLRLFDAVDFVGFQQNPFAWFAAADVYVLSSRAEGLSNVLTEALALGCRIVSTNCPSGPAEVLANGKYGRLTPVGDYNTFAKAISETLAGENLPPGTAAELENHMQAFSLKQMVDTYVQYFDLVPPPPITYRAVA